jgi:tRNA(fMet)-specific endonuclease VapC
MSTGMFVLDTDHMSLLEWDSAGAFRLRERLAEIDPAEVATTIVSYEEQVRGWMAYISRAKTIDQHVEGYRRLRSHLENYRQIPVLDFDRNAASRYEGLRRARIRIGAMDLKIAAIVLASDATLLSRNLVDFGQVPGLKVEDWTV